MNVYTHARMRIIINRLRNPHIYMRTKTYSERSKRNEYKRRNYS